MAWLTIPAKIWSNRNLNRFILHGMVDRTSLIWRICNLCHLIVCAWLTIPALYGVRNLCRFIIHAWLTVPALYGTSGHKDGHFHNTQHLYGNRVCLYMDHRTKLQWCVAIPFFTTVIRAWTTLPFST